MGNRNSVGKAQKSTDSSSSSIVPIYSEVKRLDLQHIYFNNLWALFPSPIRRRLEFGGCKILDIGCGTGTWLIEMATEYPDNEYFGVDIVPLCPQEHVPNNVVFINTDVLKGLPFEESTFDFVHQRLMVRSYNMKQWETIINEIVRVTRLGGHFELMEMDLLPQNKGPATGMLYDGFLAMMHAKGIGPTVGATMSKILKSNDDLMSLVMDSRRCLLGEWCGLYCLENGISMIKSSKKSCLEFMSVSSDKFDDLIDTCITEIEDYQTYITTHRFCGVKSNFFFF